MVESVLNEMGAGVTLCGHSRYYVKDYMIVSVGYILDIIVPGINTCDSSSIRYNLLKSNIDYTTVVLSKFTYRCYSAIVKINLQIDRVKDGMHLSYYMSGFGIHNYGS